MQGDLTVFLKKNKRERKNAFYAPSKDFCDADGEAVKWEFRAVSTSENERIREECTIEVQEKGTYRSKVDTGRYLGRLVAASVVHPNLYDAALQDSYGVKTPEALLREMIDNAGEYAALLAKVSELSGFDRDFQAEVDEAKN